MTLLGVLTVCVLSRDSPDAYSHASLSTCDGIRMRAVYPLPPHLRRDDDSDDSDEPGDSLRAHDHSSAGAYGSGQVERPATLDPITDFIRAHVPTGFVGMKVDGATVEVYRVPQVGHDLDGAVRARFPDAAVRFVDSVRDEARLAALRDRVMGDADYWHGQAVTLRGAGYDPKYGVVTIDVFEDANLVRDRFVERYGHGIVIQGGVGPLCFT
ncbi:hypothetical protein GCM10023317_66670 [Actinopolymorpha pittospori]